MKLKSILHLLSFNLFNSYSFTNNAVDVETIELTDTTRNRTIPIVIYKNKQTENLPQRVAIISGGYEVAPTAYSYIANELCHQGFLVVCIQHDLPDDAPLAFDGNLYELRLPVWQRGVQTIQFVVNYLQMKFPQTNTDDLVLIGHSNGGDISMLFATQFPDKVSHIISLDHVQMPIPRVSSPKIISFRANDTIAQNGVLPDKKELEKFGIKLIYMKDTGHSEMSDSASIKVKQKVISEIKQFIL